MNDIIKKPIQRNTIEKRMRVNDYLSRDRLVKITRKLYGVEVDFDFEFLKESKLISMESFHEMELMKRKIRKMKQRVNVIRKELEASIFQ